MRSALALVLLALLLIAPVARAEEPEPIGGPSPAQVPILPIGGLVLGEDWRNPQAAAAAIGSGMVAELTQLISGPLNWVWRWLFLVPDAIDPARAGEVDAALARIAPVGVSGPIFDGRGAAEAVEQAWQKSRRIALSAQQPYLGLVLGAFVLWSLAMLFLGRPVDLAAAMGRLAVALIGGLASFQFVDMLLRADDLLVLLFSQIGAGQILLSTPSELIAGWQGDSQAAGLADLGGALLEGVWYGLFRSFLQLLLLFGLAAIAMRLLLRLVWIWALTVAAPLVLTLAVFPPARQLPAIWLKRLLRVVFEKAAMVLGLSVSFAVIGLQPPGLLSLVLAIAALFVAQAFPGLLLDSLASAAGPSGQSVIAQVNSRIAQLRLARRALSRVGQ